MSWQRSHSLTVSQQQGKQVPCSYNIPHCKNTTCKGFNEILVNESDVKQIKSISNRPNPFSHKIDNNKNTHTTCKAALPSRAGTIKHVYKKRKTKQGTTPGRGQQLPCEVDYHPVPRQ